MDDTKSSAINDYIMGAKSITNKVSEPVLNSEPIKQTRSFLGTFGWKMWVLIILVFSFLGVNVFLYFAKGTDVLSDLLAPIIGTSVATVGETVDIAAEGAKSVVGTAEDVAKIGLLETQAVARKAKDYDRLKGSQIDLHIKKPDFLDTNTLNRAINTKRSKEENVGTYDGTEVGGKWCYVGEYNGVKSCRQLDEGDTCMSGNIFPNKDICINPTLRA